MNETGDSPHGVRGVQDILRFWIPHWIPNSNYWIPDCLSLELAFRIPIVSGIPDRLSCIPDVKAQVSRFHKQKISRFRKPAWFAFSSMGRWHDLAFSDNPYQERIMGFRLSYPCRTYTHTTCLTSNGDLCRSLHFKVRLSKDVLCNARQPEAKPLLSFFSLIKTIYPSVSTKPLPNDAKSLLPGYVLISRTPSRSRVTWLWAQYVRSLFRFSLFQALRK